jgi:hypothetical protein
MYDADDRRFMAVDPVMDGLNWYTYCLNNPLKYVDPFGLYNRLAAVAYATNPAYSSPDVTNPILQRFSNHNPEYLRMDNILYWRAIKSADIMLQVHPVPY